MYVYIIFEILFITSIETLFNETRIFLFDNNIILLPLLALQKKKGSVATFLKHGYRSEKRSYRMIWPIATFF